MKIYSVIKMIPFLLIGIILVTACTGDYTDDFIKNVEPAIPVTYDGATTAGFNPYYLLAYNGGNAPITITLKIPVTSKVKIKEITKAIAGATSIIAGNLKGTDPGTTVLSSYISAPIAADADGYTVTFNTTISEFNSYVAASNKITGTPPTGATFSERAFMFLLTMEDDSEIIPMPCRIRVTP